MDRIVTSTTEKGEAFVSSLFKTVMNAEEGSIEALEELSGIAMGGHETAKALIDQIDEATASGELKLPWSVVQNSLTTKTANKRIMMPPEHPIF